MEMTMNNQQDAAQLEPGDLIKVSLDPTVGHEQQAWRPCVVLSVREWNSVTRGLVTICPLTSNRTPNPNLESLWVDPTQTDCGVFGTVMLDHVRSIDVVARGAKKVGRIIDEQVLDDIRMGMCLILGVDKTFFGEES
jgi:mRNA-degrading endonuclease toxin of MazEF toxin-antitoxin module